MCQCRLQATMVIVHGEKLWQWYCQHQKTWLFSQDRPYEMKEKYPTYREVNDDLG